MYNNRFAEWIYMGVFYLAAGLTCVAVFLRTYLVYRDTTVLWQGLGLVLLFWMLFLAEVVLIPHRNLWFHLYIILQTIVVSLLIYTRSFEVYDYFSNLYAILGMQMMQRINIKFSAMWIIIFLTLIGIKFFQFEGLVEGLTRFLSFGSVIVFISSYSLATRRAQEATIHAKSLRQQLQDANDKLEQSVDTLRNLSVVRERQRLARELHDSVTQTIFSMTLTTQSALLLLDKDAKRVGIQLDRLNQLAQSAMAEVQTLISELRPEQLTRGGLATAIRQHIAGQALPEGLSVTLEVDDEHELPPLEAQGLFRIAQEALNNIVKHAKARNVKLRLHTNTPFWIEIDDDGQGFDTQQALESGHIGLTGMHERADEIGWNLIIQSTPGMGTHIRAEKIYPIEERT
jgi:signal transduction histidine kinase